LSRFPRQYGVDVDGIELRLDGLKAPEPVRVVFRLQSERDIHAQPERPLVGEGNAEIQVWHHCTTAGVSPGAAEGLQRRSLGAAVVKLGRWADDIGGDDRLQG